MAPRGVATGVKTPERGPSPPRSLLRLALLLLRFALALLVHPLFTRVPGQILWALAPGWLTPLAIWHPYPHGSLLLALSTEAPVADTAGHSGLGSRAFMQPPRRSKLGGMDGVVWTSQSAAVPAVTTARGLPRQSDPGTAGLEIPPSHRPHQQQPPGHGAQGGSSTLARSAACQQRTA